jgi:hypothetical protein
MSSIIKWFSGNEILSDNFGVFAADDLNDGTCAYAVGIENAFHARYKWEKEVTIFYPIIGPDAMFDYFPFDDCYSHRN